MKVLLINGSPHSQGCTFTALNEVAGALNSHGIATEILQLGTKPVHGCIACRKCSELGRCVFDDQANEWAEKAREADGIIIGSPVYYAAPNGALCAVLDRLFYSSGNVFKDKPGSAVVSCRRGGATASLDRLNKYFTISNMPLVSSQYWNMVHGNSPEEVQQDEEGLQIMRTLGNNMAWLLNSIQAANLQPPTPEKERKRTNFIR